MLRFGPVIVNNRLGEEVMPLGCLVEPAINDWHGDLRRRSCDGASVGGDGCDAAGLKAEPRANLSLQQTQLGDVNRPPALHLLGAVEGNRVYNDPAGISVAPPEFDQTERRELLAVPVCLEVSRRVDEDGDGAGAGLRRQEPANACYLIERTTVTAEPRPMQMRDPVLKPRSIELPPANEVAKPCRTLRSGQPVRNNVLRGKRSIAAGVRQIEADDQRAPLGLLFGDSKRAGINFVEIGSMNNDWSAG